TGDRESTRDRDRARDQLAAGPARHARRDRAGLRGSRRPHRRLERRASCRRARLRRDRDRAGAPGLAHEEAGAEAAVLGADREDASAMSLREDGQAALDWAARYLEQVGDYPVLAQVEPGQIRARLPESPPDQGEPFAALLRDLDEIILPGITHWQSP